MIIKLTREGAELARYATEEEAAKANKLTLPLLRSHLNAKKPKMLDGCVYQQTAHQHVEQLPVPEGGGCVSFEVVTTRGTPGLADELASEINYAPTTPEAFDGKPLEKFTADEAGQWPTVDMSDLTPEAQAEMRTMPISELGDLVHPVDPEPQPPGEEPGLDLRTLASRQLTEPAPTGSLEEDFDLTLMEKRRKEQNATRLQK